MWKEDQESRLKALEMLPFLERSAFAALCATRLCAGVGALGCDPSSERQVQVQELLRELWRELDSRRRHGVTSVASLTDLIPEESTAEGMPGEPRLLVECEVVALEFARRSRIETAIENVVWAADRAIEAVSAYAALPHRGVPTAPRAAIEAETGHPAIRAERGRQSEDLVDLGRMHGQGGKPLRTLRDRAWSAGEGMFFR